MNIEQVAARSAARNITPEVAASHKGFDLSGLERQGVDVRIIKARSVGTRSPCEQHGVGSRQNLRPALGTFAARRRVSKTSSRALNPTSCLISRVNLQSPWRDAMSKVQRPSPQLRR